MSGFETVEIPFKTFGNRRGLTQMQLAENPWLADFVNMFVASFEFDPVREILLLVEPV